MISPHFSRRIAATPIPVCLAIVGVLNVVLPARVPPEMVYNPAILLVLLQTVFIFASSCLVAFISLRSYLSGGSRGILLLGCGTLAWGLANIIASYFFSTPGGSNILVTLVSTGGLLASSFHIASAIGTSTGARRDTRLLKPKLAICYSGVILFLLVLTALAVMGLTPPFFVPGSGTTMLRQAIVLAGVSLFSLSSIIFARLYYSSRSGILFWYSMALALTAVGIGASFFGRTVGDPIAWTSRTAVYLGGVYFLVAVWSATRHPAEQPEPRQD